jgi:formiminotetrahydrofolate cyclodeaminase
MKFTIDSTFLNALADPSPTPAGGSAAAYSGAMAAALVTMVAQTTLAKKKYAAIQPRMKQIATEAEACRTELEACVSRDANAFDALIAAYRAAKISPDPTAIEQATIVVTVVPLGTANTALHVLELAVEVAETGNINAVSDACAAATLANSSIFASLLNVKVNAKSLDDRKAVGFLTQAAETDSQATALMTHLDQIIRERMGIHAVR